MPLQDLRWIGCLSYDRANANTGIIELSLNAPDERVGTCELRDVVQ